MKNRAVLSCWLLLGVACGNASGGSPSMSAGGNPSGGTAGVSMSGAAGTTAATSGGGGAAGTGIASGGGAGFGGSAGSAHGGGSGTGGGGAGMGSSGTGGGSAGGSIGGGDSGGAKGVPGVPSGPVVLCFGNGCPLGTCDHNKVLSQTACTSLYTSDVGPTSMYCNAGETGTYCMQVTDDFGDRFEITCANGAATILRCNTGCQISGTSPNDPAMCD